ncbi:MAG: response regulator [Thermodesulfobacteriota bacterium]
MTQKVLVVDDDPDVRSFVVTVLEENGYSPLQAGDGVEGLEIIESERPDLVILDVLMPRGSGIRLYRKLKTNETLKNIPVILLTGIAYKSFLRSQRTLAEFQGDPVPEPDAYLEKPVEPEELADTINRNLK